MKTLRQLERLKKAHKLIQQNNTGTPIEFANKLHISEREMFRTINFLKEMDAQVIFNRKSNTYFYTNNFELSIHISIEVLVDNELKKIYGGETIFIKKEALLDLGSQHLYISNIK
jgi:hypothetical protein